METGKTFLLVVEANFFSKINNQDFWYMSSLWNNYHAFKLITCDILLQSMEHSLSLK